MAAKKRTLKQCCRLSTSFKRKKRQHRSALMFTNKNSVPNYQKKCLGIIYVIATVIVTLMIIYLENSSRGKKVSISHLRFLKKIRFHNEGTLMDLKDFRYIINNNACNVHDQKEITAVVIVTSYAGDVETRSAIRRSYPSKLLSKFGIRRVFLLALIHDDKNYNQVSQNAIQDENNRFKDIIQGNFYEAYRNLTYKHIMGLSWVANYCSQAKYVIKMDHDIIFDFYRLKTLLKKVPHSQYLLAGYVLTNMKPIREPANKWYVGMEEYSRSNYPNFLSGWLYITTPHTVQLLCELSLDTPYFWIDDLYVTGLLVEQTNISLVKLNKYFTTHPEYLQCCIDKPKYSCEFLIGPTNNDNKLMLQFEKYSENCFYKNCKKRKEENSLRNTCIAKWKEEPFGKGRPIIDQIHLS